MLSEKLGYIHLDTGALYRALGLYAVSRGISPGDAQHVKGLLNSVRLELRNIDNTLHVFLDGDDVTQKLRTPEISRAAADVSAQPAVRSFLLNLQKNIARESSVIMDGRDIGTVVLPSADVKIFLTATVEDRAKRRYQELISKGEKVVFKNVLHDMAARDKQDSEREIAPLRPADDAIIVDTTGYELEDSLGRILAVVKEQLS